MTDRLRLACSDVDDLAALYVLDALGADEAAEVAAHLADHAQRHPSFAELAGVTPFLAESIDPMAPPPDLRARLMGVIAATPQVGPLARPAAESAPAAVPAPSVVSGSLAVPGPAPIASPGPVPEVPYPATTTWQRPTSIDDVRRDRARERRSTPRRWTLLAAAAVLAIVAFGGWNLLAERREADHRRALLADAAAAANQPGFEVAQLTGSEGAAGATGYAVFPADKPGYIVLTGLPPAPGDQTWQAWTIADGPPSSAGLMHVGSDGLAVLEGVERIPGTQIVALTIEPAGGSEGPTTTPVVVGQLETPLAWSADGVLALLDTVRVEDLA